MNVVSMSAEQGMVCGSLSPALLVRPPIQKWSSAGKNITFRSTKQNTIVKVILAVINIDTLVAALFASTVRSNMGAMDSWSNMCRNRVNRSAGDVVAPSLVEAAKRLELKSRNAVEFVLVLLI
jgi:hypothetical protein